MSSTKHPITVLISGNGTNLQALIDATTTANTTTTNTTENQPPPPSLPTAQITHVISNRKAAYGLTRAKEANIPTTYHNLVPYKKQHPDTESGLQTARSSYDHDLAHIIINHDPKPVLVVCAGWMHILTSSFIDTLRDADVGIINLHPALPGQFDGADAIARAWAAFQRGEIVSTGVMIHHVIGGVDAGRPIVTQEVECWPEEKESELEARIHRVEWGLIVKGTAMALEEIEESRRERSSNSNSGGAPAS